MKNAMQLKAQVKNIAAKKGVPAQTILQSYMLERLLERITLSRFRSQFNIRDIREDDVYGGIRLALEALFPPMAVKLKLDITSGDKITPREMEYSYRLLFEERSICVMAYNLETILAEKLETILSRGIYNTRPRNFYDLIF